MWSERWRKCAKFLKELDQGMVRLHQLAHKYQGIRIPSPEAEAFAKEWPEWWKRLKKVISLWSSDPHGALLVMRLKGLLPADCIFRLNLPPDRVELLRRLYGSEAPECIERTPVGQPCRAEERGRDLLVGLLLYYWTCAVFVTDSPAYPDHHTGVRSLIRRGRLLFEEAAGDRGLSGRLSGLIASEPPVSSKPRARGRNGVTAVPPKNSVGANEGARRRGTPGEAEGGDVDFVPEMGWAVLPARRRGAPRLRERRRSAENAGRSFRRRRGGRCDEARRGPAWRRASWGRRGPAARRAARACRHRVPDAAGRCGSSAR